MTAIKLLGGARERQTLSRHLIGISWDEGHLDDIQDLPPSGDIWIVCQDHALAFGAAVSNRRRKSPAPNAPRAILWVPAGQKPLPFQDWWSVFSLQLEETHQDAALLLTEILRRPQLLLWSERIASVPNTWYEKLSDHPVNVEVRRLPFSQAIKEELLQNDEDLAWVRTRLGQLAEAQWAMLCPSSEDITAWLETDLANPIMEARLKRVALARAAMERQLVMLEGAGLIPAVRAAAKRQAVRKGVNPGAIPWLRSSLLWHRSHIQSLGQLAAGVAARLTHGEILKPSFHTVRGQEALADAASASLDALVTELQNGEAVDFSVDGKWIHFLFHDVDLLIRIGENPVKRFTDFRLEFRHGMNTILTVSAVQGIVRLTPEHLKQLQEGRANQLAIFL